MFSIREDAAVAARVYFPLLSDRQQTDRLASVVAFSDTRPAVLRVRCSIHTLRLLFG